MFLNYIMTPPLAAFLLICTIALGQNFERIENPACIPKTDTLDGQYVFQVADRMPEYPSGFESMYKLIGKTLSTLQAKVLFMSRYNRPYTQ